MVTIYNTTLSATSQRHFSDGLGGGMFLDHHRERSNMVCRLMANISYLCANELSISGQMTYRGIIYRRYIINDKGKEVSYVGQTCDPDKRNADFLNLRVQYSGLRIENALKKYGPENFSYEVLETVTSKSESELTRRLNELEVFYIEKFNSFYDGYNHTLGGGGANGYRLIAAVQMYHPYHFEMYRL